MGIANVTRPCAFVFPRADDRILVSRMTDADDATYYRAPGGGIEFRERSDEAARRELREELDIEVDELALLGVLETTFEIAGEPYHEIAFIFEAWVGRSTLEGLEGRVIGGDPRNLEIIEVMAVEALRAHELPLYPEGCDTLLFGDAQV